MNLEELARLLGGRVMGDGKTALRGVNGLKEAGPGEIAFLANPKYAPLLASTRASAVIVAEGIDAPLPSIVVRNPDQAFAPAAQHFQGAPHKPPPGIHPSAAVSSRASVGKNVAIGACTVVEDGAILGDCAVLFPQVYVGREARIGADSILYPQVVVRERCQVGARVILHSGVVVGSDGFGYATEKGVHHKIPQVGIVVVEDDVEIGANTALDRARFGKTVIGRGTKIDNLVQIGHNVVVGEGCLIVAQAGVSGSTKLGRNVILGGQAGLAGHLELGDGVMLTARLCLLPSQGPGGQIRLPSWHPP